MTTGSWILDSLPCHRLSNGLRTPSPAFSSRGYKSLLLLLPIRLLGPQRVMVKPQNLPKLVKQLPFWIGNQHRPFFPRRFFHMQYPPAPLPKDFGQERKELFYARTLRPISRRFRRDTGFVSQTAVSTTCLAVSIPSGPPHINICWTESRDSVRIHPWLPISRLFRRSKKTVRQIK